MNEWIGPSITGFVTLCITIGGWAYAWAQNKHKEPVTLLDSAFVRANRVSEVSSDLVTQLWTEINRLQETVKTTEIKIGELESHKTQADARALQQDKRIDRLRSEFDAYREYISSNWSTLRLNTYPPSWPISTSHHGSHPAS